MGDPNDTYHEAECGCSLSICGCCGSCHNCCECCQCPDCNDDDNMYRPDSSQWCSDCDRCKDHCECAPEEDEEVEGEVYYRSNNSEPPK